MIKNGIYCSVTAQEVIDKHGGVDVKDFYYNHVCFYYPDNKVGLYGGSKLWASPFITGNLRYVGEITRLDEAGINFYVVDSAHNDRILFSGQFSGDQIQLVAKRESKPEHILFQEVFEYIGTGNNEVL